MTRIVILVIGGVVESVHSNEPDTEVVLVDFDNLEQEGLSSDERDAKHEEAIKLTPHEVL